MAERPFRLWELATTDEGGDNERAQFHRATRREIKVAPGDYEALALYRAVVKSGYPMPYSEALELYVWEIAVLLGKADVQEPDAQNSEIDAMLRMMNPRPPSSERKG